MENYSRSKFQGSNFRREVPTVDSASESEWSSVYATDSSELEAEDSQANNENRECESPIVITKTQKQSENLVDSQKPSSAKMENYSRSRVRVIYRKPGPKCTTGVHSLQSSSESEWETSVSATDSSEVGAEVTQANADVCPSDGYISQEVDYHEHLDNISPGLDAADDGSQMEDSSRNEFHVDGHDHVECEVPDDEETETDGEVEQDWHAVLVRELDKYEAGAVWAFDNKQGSKRKYKGKSRAVKNAEARNQANIRKEKEKMYKAVILARRGFTDCEHAGCVFASHELVPADLPDIVTKMVEYRERTQSDRRQWLADTIASTYGNMFSTAYPHFAPVCKKCFCLYHGIGKNSFYRRAAEVRSGTKNFAHGNKGKKKTTKTSALPLALAWLDRYSKTHGDFMPHKNEIHLPDYEWKIVHAKMRRVLELQGIDAGNIPEYPSFLQAAKDSLPTVKVRKYKRFSKCTECSHLDEKIKKSTGNVRRTYTGIHFANCFPKASCLEYCSRTEFHTPFTTRHVNHTTQPCVPDKTYTARTGIQFANCFPMVKNSYRT